MSGDADVSRTAAQTTHDDGIPGSEPGIIDLMDPGQDEGTPSLPPRLDSQPALHEPESTPQHAIQDEDEHPQVALLRAMFPDFDGAVLLSVLESVDYDQDRAIDALLGMSDPEYVSTQGQAPPPHDVSLDEQLARQLALEDQPEPRHASGQAWPRRNSVPYQPRQSAPSHNQQAQNVTGSERGDFQEFQETIGRMAESGKKTFSSIMSKAKAKINEYNQQYNQRSGQPSSVDNSNNSQWDSTSRPQLDRHTTSQAYAQQYYNYGSSDNLESPSDDTHPPITLNGKQPSVSGRDEVKGYDIEPSAPSGPPAYASQPSMPVSRPSGDTPRPPPASNGGSIDAAKLGLLPKRPVSLLPQQQDPTKQRSDDEDEELDYVENPFEEGRN